MPYTKNILGQREEETLVYAIRDNRRGRCTNCVYTSLEEAKKACQVYNSIGYNDELWEYHERYSVEEFAVVGTLKQ